MVNNIQYGKKRKTIVRILNKKLDEWFDSILDKKVQEAVKKDTIITGGCITSMLLGETVNDYDVYFKTKETTLLVAHHYAAQFTSAAAEVKSEGDRIKIFIQSSGVAGSIPDENQGDEEDDDIFSCPDDHEKLLYAPIFMSQNAITLANKVQLIVRFYGEPSEIHKNFDFVHAKCSFDYAKQELNLPAEALEAMLSRTLVYSGSLYPICSIFRAKKFVNRGWNIGAGEYLKMAFQINELNLKSMEVLNDQLIGVDSFYMRRLIEALSSNTIKNHPEKINATYVIALIDKIFN